MQCYKILYSFFFLTNITFSLMIRNRMATETPMKGIRMSHIAWIDFDQDERERTRRLLDQLKGREARDELGLGSIRDAFSDLMFPGTSAIQTRLRYMLFVPWIYKLVANSSCFDKVDYAKSLENKLVYALEAGNEEKWVIGREAREDLTRLPSSIYWSGLKKLDILEEPGSREEVLFSQGSKNVWALNLPDPPNDFLKNAKSSVNFCLTLSEANFLRDRLALSASSSLWYELARNHDTAESEQIWLHPHRSEWSKETEGIVDHAERFASAMHGAALLYNFMLAKEKAVMHGNDESGSTDLVEDYRSKIENWKSEDPIAKVNDWDISSLWPLIGPTNHNVRTKTKHFINDWRRIMLDNKGNIIDCTRAQKTNFKPRT